MRCDMSVNVHIGDIALGSRCCGIDEDGCNRNRSVQKSRARESAIVFHGFCQVFRDALLRYGGECAVNGLCTVGECAVKGL